MYSTESKAPARGPAGQLDLPSLAARASIACMYLCRLSFHHSNVKKKPQLRSSPPALLGWGVNYPARYPAISHVPCRPSCLPRCPIFIALALPRPQRDVMCSTCMGRGRQLCKACHGAGKFKGVNCEVCDGKGNIPCVRCGGARFVFS